MSDVFEQICGHLEERGVSFRHLHHAPTPTSVDSARARGEPLEIGGKALVLVGGERSVVLVLSAACRFDSKAFRRAAGMKKSRFLRPEELLARTGLVPGSVPPFGPPILPFELFIDASILAQPRIAFNAGSLRDSIIMSREAYLRAVGEFREVDVALAVAGDAVGGVPADS